MPSPSSGTGGRLAPRASFAACRRGVEGVGRVTRPTTVTTTGRTSTRDVTLARTARTAGRSRARGSQVGRLCAATGLVTPFGADGTTSPVSSGRRNGTGTAGLHGLRPTAASGPTTGLVEARLVCAATVSSTPTALSTGRVTAAGHVSATADVTAPTPSRASSPCAVTGRTASGAGDGTSTTSTSAIVADVASRTAEAASPATLPTRGLAVGVFDGSPDGLGAPSPVSHGTLPATTTRAVAGRGAKNVFGNTFGG